VGEHTGDKRVTTESLISCHKRWPNPPSTPAESTNFGKLFEQSLALIFSPKPTVAIAQAQTLG